MKFDDIYKKIEAGGRLSREEGVFCLTEAPLMELGELATLARRRAVGEQAYYQYNYNINYTNICENECKFCAFFRKETDGYQMSPEQIADNVRRVHAGGVNEVHIVGGLNRKLPYCYYLETLKAIKAVDRRIHIQGFTAVEIAFIAEIGGKTTRETLAELHAAGLDSLPGGGAEIFADRVRQEICEKKVPAETWLRVHEEAHQLGLHTNATMLYGHVETPVEVIDHLDQLRTLQDRTHGFQAFVPLAFFPQNTKIELPTVRRGGVHDMRLIATARLYLDNLPHLKSMWMIYGYKLCQAGLEFGADDIGGTYFDEEIVHSAGAKTPKSLTEADIRALISGVNRIPVMVNSDYETVGGDR